MARKFLRRDIRRHLKLGKRRKKKLKWIKPKGRHNKMRERRRGYPISVNIGFRKNKKLRSLIKEKSPVIVKNISDMEKAGKNDIIILGKIGKRKKISIAKIAKEKKIQIANLNIDKFLEKTEKKKAKTKKQEDKKEKESKKIEKVESKEVEK